MKMYVVSVLGLLGLSMIFFQCQEKKEESPYLNVSNPSAHYVGMNECKTCHASIYESFMRTGMGKSWGAATKQKSAADFTPAHALVYDSIKDFYYKPFWDKDSLCILEFRLSGKDTIYRRLEKVSYIVGSGQHTNSHILNINGYLHQAPITFYTQKGRWDLAPGFEKGSNSRFDRKIEMECMTCHNGYPELVEGSFNKYAKVATGIDCERCHGPGSIHIANKKNADIIDTATSIDYSIVNPKKLSTELQNNLCQRCHLQGITVLNEGKTFMDFKPSQALKQTMNTFMPVYSEDENHMIMASHVERMKLSSCYVNSGKMSCITCHNPHVSVKETPQAVFIQACQTCHQTKHTCTESLLNREKLANNCITCHMPKNGSIDIPHVAVTDHLIRIPAKPISAVKAKEVAQFLHMQCYNNNQVDDRTRARSFLEFYERYQPSPIFLDSVVAYLKGSSTAIDKDMIRLWYLKEDYPSIVAMVKALDAGSMMDAWTNYRIGEAYSKQNNFARATEFLAQACKLKPYALDFQSKYATALIQSRQWAKAKNVCQFILSENPRFGLAHFNMGYILEQEQNLPQAKQEYELSLQCNPDHVQSLVNLATVYYRLNQKGAVKPLLLRALKLDPNHATVKALLADLKG